MQKPLSPKTLEKRYAELGLSDEKLQLLHTFFRCASNFYGVLPVSHAWQVFKHYEGLRVHKKDFVAFSGVAQRDASLPYAIYELRELYSDEPWGDPLDRAIVNKDMVMHGYYRFLYVYNTLENQRCQSFLVPDQEIFLSFAEDRFYLTPQGKAMVDFIGGLRAGGTQRRWNGEVIGPMLDLNGEPALGKRLSGPHAERDVEQQLQRRPQRMAHGARGHRVAPHRRASAHLAPLPALGGRQGVRRHA